MSAQTEIAWCDSTFNPWIGCTKVGPGCDHCYAERDQAQRRGRVQWGAGQARSRTSSDYWKQPLRWNAQRFAGCNECGQRGVPVKGKTGYQCSACGHVSLSPVRRRVFCASLADVFDNEVDPAWRRDLFDLIRATPSLDWLLLTKRVGIAQRLFDEAHPERARWPLNVWLGSTVVNQEEVDRDVPKLLRIPVGTRFLSIEPMLDRIDLCEQFGMWWNSTMQCWESTRSRGVNRDHGGSPLIDWVICGGESGPGARPLRPEWVRSLRDQCAGAVVPFLFKQWGEWAPALGGMYFYPVDGCSDFPVRASGSGTVRFDDGLGLVRLGKKRSGRLLDGVQHDGFPA